MSTKRTLKAPILQLQKEVMTDNTAGNRHETLKLGHENEQNSDSHKNFERLD